MQRLDRTPDVVKLRSPYAQDTISKDGHSALVSFEIPGTFDSVGGKVAPSQATTAAAQAAHPAFTIAEAGDGSFSKAYADTQGKDLQKAEQLSLPITLLILIIAFGGLLIAGIPVALAMSAVIAALGLTSVASQLLPVTDATQSVILLIGLAVGVDYSIFYIARQRQERARGAGEVDAIEIAAATSGRAVLVSGLTVMAAMSGMFLAGNGVFSGIALATILVVATAIIGSLTVLPALLAPKSAGVLRACPGPSRDRARLPLRRSRHRRRLGLRHLAVPHGSRAPLRNRRGETTIWQRVLRPVLRHPVISVVASVAILVALAIPAAGLKLGLAPADYGMSKSLPVMQAKAAIDKAFPGSPVARRGRDRGQGRHDAARHAGDRALRAGRARERARVPPVHAQRLEGPLGRTALRPHQGRRPQRGRRRVDEGAAQPGRPEHARRERRRRGPGRRRGGGHARTSTR